MNNCFVDMPSFDLYRQDHGRGGGVCVYVKDVFKVTKLKLREDKVNGIEDLWLSVQLRKLPSFIVGCMYRHPKSPATSFDFILNTFNLNFY